MIQCPHCNTMFTPDHQALTKRQLEVLEYLERYIAVRRYAPSYEEIATALRVSSLATVHGHIEELERKGILRRDPRSPSRSITLLVRSDELE